MRGKEGPDPHPSDRWNDEETLRVPPLVDRGPPKRLGHYLVGEFLGKGAMGRVHLGTNEATGATVVLKMVAIDDRPAFVKALRDEVASLACINAPHIPRIHHCGEDEGFIWLAEEFIAGRDLKHYLADVDDRAESMHMDFDESSITDGARPESPEGGGRAGAGFATANLERHLRWFRSLAGALVMIHEQGLVHRDIKPANIVIGPQETPYLIDFGLAVDQEDFDRIVGQQAGTMLYMSPEQAAGAWSGLGAASDVYSLAVTFVEVLTGRRVVRTGGRYSPREQIQFQPVPTPHEIIPELPESLDPIFRKATAKALPDRYRSASELLRDLDLWFEKRGRGSSTLRPRTYSSALLLGSLMLVLTLSPRFLCSEREAPPNPPAGGSGSPGPVRPYRFDPGRPLISLAAAIAILRSREPSDIELSEIKRAIDVGGRERAIRLLETQGYELTRDVVVREGEEPLPPLRRVYADDAEFLRRQGLDTAELLFHRAYSAVMDENIELAREMLAAPATDLAAEKTPERIQALRLLVARASEDRDTITELDERITRSSDAIASALYVMGFLWTRSVTGDSHQWAVDRLQRHLDGDSRYRRLLRTLLARVFVEAGLDQKAIEQIRMLTVDLEGISLAQKAKEIPSLAVIEIGCHLRRAETPAARDDGDSQASSLARALLHQDPGAIDAILDELHRSYDRLSAAHVVAWLASLEEQLPSRVILRVPAADLLRAFAVDLADEGDALGAEMLARSILLREVKAPSDEERSISTARACLAWALVGELATAPDDLAEQRIALILALDDVDRDQEQVMRSGAWGNVNGLASAKALDRGLLHLKPPAVILEIARGHREAMQSGSDWARAQTVLAMGIVLRRLAAPIILLPTCRRGRG